MIMNKIGNEKNNPEFTYISIGETCLKLSSRLPHEKFVYFSLSCLQFVEEANQNINLKYPKKVGKPRKNVNK